MDDATEKSAKVEVAVTPPSDSGPVQNGVAHNVEEVNVFFILFFIYFYIGKYIACLIVVFTESVHLNSKKPLIQTVYNIFNLHLQRNPVHGLPYIKALLCPCPSM